MLERAVFAAGCFWGVEAKFRRVDGVVDTQVGYSGGFTDHPTYEQICTDTTGHAEVVEVIFENSIISYAQLIEAFWKLHDPTQLNRQGPDEGRQYRSAIFFCTEEQQKIAEAAKAAINAAGRFNRPVVTEIVPASAFWRAEEYHQRYLDKRGSTTCGIH